MRFDRPARKSPRHLTAPRGRPADFVTTPRSHIGAGAQALGQDKAVASVATVPLSTPRTLPLSHQRERTKVPRDPGLTGAPAARTGKMQARPTVKSRPPNTSTRLPDSPGGVCRLDCFIPARMLLEDRRLCDGRAAARSPEVLTPYKLELCSCHLGNCLGVTLCSCHFAHATLLMPLCSCHLPHLL